MPGKPNILVTGKNGQLGSELQSIASKYPQYNFFFTDRETLDISEDKDVKNFFSKHPISFCINAAAYTAVDKAETEKELALKINAEAVKNLAVACKVSSCKLIHISTDYVFDGTGTVPYKEVDKTNPVNFYGETKLKGEEYALSTSPDFLIIRTSWVYSAFGKNFVKTMLRSMQDRPAISVVNDQFGSPTYAKDLAEAIMAIIKRNSIAQSWSGGIYHFSNDGTISWYEFAQEIKEISASSCKVVPIPSSSYPTPAKRPGYSVFDKTKITSTFSIELKDWKASLQRCIAELREAKY